MGVSKFWARKSPGLSAEASVPPPAPLIADDTLHAENEHKAEHPDHETDGEALAPGFVVHGLTPD